MAALQRENAALKQRVSEAERALASGTETLRRQFSDKVKALEEERSQLRASLSQKEQTEQWQMENVRMHTWCCLHYVALTES